MEVSNIVTKQQNAGEKRVPSQDVFLRLTVALILILAAAGKAYAGKTYQGWNLQHEARLFVQSVIEAALGLWLASGFQSKRAVRTAILCFAIFVPISAYETWKGAPTCGCFGAVIVSPGYTLALDLAVLTSLIGSQRISRPLRRMLPLLTITVMAAIFVSLHNQVVSGIAFAPSAKQTGPQSSSPQAASDQQALVVGTGISPTQWSADLGAVKQGSSHVVVFNLTSPLPRNITVRGVNAGCSCLNVPSPPSIIPAGHAIQVRVTFNAPARPMHDQASVQLTTDAPELPPLSLRIEADVQ